jgi:hypothetical protein
MNDKLLKASIRWADGTYDHVRTCIECGLDTCSKPVYPERYKIISSSKARAFDAVSFNIDIAKE